MNTPSLPWRIEGDYFEACNCHTACPCVWLQPPSEGECKLFVAWHIARGHAEEVTLDGLNVALICHAPGSMPEGQWAMALYLDARATPEQTAQLTRIFSGQWGGHPAVLARFAGEFLGVKHVAMHYHAAEKTRQISLDGLAEVHIRAIRGISGEVATIDNPPLCVVPSHPSIVAESVTYRYHDYRFDWTFSGRNGYYSPFCYQPT